MVGSAIRQGLQWGTGRLDRLGEREACLDGRRPCDALILDIDDTLLDTQRAIRVAAQTAALELWPTARTSHRERFAELFQADPQGYYGGSGGQAGFHDMRKLRIATAAAQLGLPWQPRGYRRFCGAFDPAFAAAQRAYPDALPAVEAVRRWGIAVVLLTNSSARATEIKLQALGLMDRFPHVVTADTLGFGKPDPRVFLHACVLVGAQPQRCVSVGDHYANDVVAARAAGLRALWLDRGCTQVNRGACAPAEQGESGGPSIPTLAALPAALMRAL